MLDEILRLLVVDPYETQETRRAAREYLAAIFDASKSPPDSGHAARRDSDWARPGIGETTPALAVEIGGLTAGTEHDQLVVGGDATLAGTLTIRLLDGYEPAIGETVTIISAAALTGAFTTLDGLAIGNGKRRQVNVRATAVTLQVVAE